MRADRLPAKDPAPSIEVLVQQNAPAVLALCLACTRNLHDAEDLVQETLLKATTSITDLREPRAVRSWLLQIARRLCINHHNRKKPALALPEEIPVPAEAVDPDIERLHLALTRIPTEYRETICLYYLDGRSCAAVAESLGISEVAVRVPSDARTRDAAQAAQGGGAMSHNPCESRHERIAALAIGEPRPAPGGRTLGPPGDLPGVPGSIRGDGPGRALRPGYVRENDQGHHPPTNGSPAD